MTSTGHTRKWQDCLHESNKLFFYIKISAAIKHLTQTRKSLSNKTVYKLYRQMAISYLIQNIVLITYQEENTRNYSCNTKSGISDHYIAL